MISNKIFESLSRDGLRKLNSSFKHFQNSSILYSTNTNLKATQTKNKTEKLDLINQKQTSRVINPLKHDDFFELNKLVKLEELFK